MSSAMVTLKTRNCLDDRRVAHRYKLDWAVRILAKDRAEPEPLATLRNLSSTGALIYLDTELRVGDRVFILIKLPFQNEIWMSYSATVVRVMNETTDISAGLKFDTSRPDFKNIAVSELLLKPLM
jgi:hypothetical protein